MTNRRGNGERSISRHPKRDLWMARYTVETPAGTKRRTVYGKTRAEVEDQGLVFAGEGGGLVNPSNLRHRSFLPLLKKAGLPGITFHDLRHTCATLLLSQGTHPNLV